MLVERVGPASQYAVFGVNEVQGLRTADGGGTGANQHPEHRVRSGLCARSGLCIGKGAAVWEAGWEAGNPLWLHLLVRQQVCIVANWRQVISLIPVGVLVLHSG